MSQSKRSPSEPIPLSDIKPGSIRITYGEEPVLDPKYGYRLRRKQYTTWIDAKTDEYMGSWRWIGWDHPEGNHDRR